MKQEIDNVDNLIAIANQLYSTELKRHNDALHPLNVLSLLVYLGYTKKDGLEPVYDLIIEKQTDDAFTILINIPKAFGGKGEAVETWLSCDLPLLTYIAVKLNGGKITLKHRKSMEKILTLREANGWRCKGSDAAGKFRGPGKKEDECPIVMVLVAKMLSVTPENEYADEKNSALNGLFRLWAERKTRKPYLFGMGTDFAKLKFPMIWYDILHVADIVSRYPQAVEEKEFREMMAIIRAAIKENGYVPQSVYMAWKGYDFGQKKKESLFLKNAILAIEKRISGI